MRNSLDAESLKDHINIVDIVREYVPSLKKTGRTYKARCPFHDEKTPSFCVDEQKGLYYCFGCQKGGDVLDFVMKIETLSFVEAAEKLAKKAGLEWKPKHISTSQDKLRLEIKQSLEFAADYYHSLLMNDKRAEPAREYLKKRQIGKTISEKFRLGFALDGYDNFFKAAVKQKFTSSVLKQAGLIIEKEQNTLDYFRSRIMFPITNASAEVIGFGGRVLIDEQPKYLNSPETVLFHKSRVLFGLDAAAQSIRKQKYAVLLEGYTDVIACHKAGICNTVAPLGTAVGAGHAKILKRYSGEVVLLFDADTAGINAAIKGGQILTENGLYVRTAALPKGLDPDEYLKKYGAESLEKVISSAKDISAFHTAIMLEGKTKPLSARDKVYVTDELCQTISKQQDKIIKDEWVKSVSEKLDIDYAILKERTGKVNYRSNADDRSEIENIPEEKFPLEEELISILIKFPKYIDACKELTEEHFSGVKVKNIFSALKQAASKNKDDISGFLLKKLPDEKDLITKLTLIHTPDTFQPQSDIKHIVKLIIRLNGERKLKDIQKQIKKLKDENKDVTELQIQKSKLAVMLKSSNRKSEES